MDLFIGTIGLAMFGIALSIRNGWRNRRAYATILGIVVITILVTLLGKRFEEGVAALAIAALAGWFVNDLVVGTATATGRLVRRLAPWTIGALLVVWLMKYQPGLVASLIGIAFCFIAIGWMARRLLPGNKKK